MIYILHGLCMLYWICKVACVKFVRPDAVMFAEHTMATYAVRTTGQCAIRCHKDATCAYFEHEGSVCDLHLKPNQEIAESIGNEWFSKFQPNPQLYFSVGLACDDEIRAVYVDGYRLPLGPTFNKYWIVDVYQNLYFTNGTNGLFALQAWDNHGIGHISMYLYETTQVVGLIRCGAYTEEVGWTNPSFDDSHWPPAFIIDDPDSQATLKFWEGPYRPSLDIFCRIHLRFL